MSQRCTGPEKVAQFGVDYNINGTTDTAGTNFTGLYLTNEAFDNLGARTHRFAYKSQ